MMEAFNIPVFSAQGYEADDVIGTLAVQAADAGIDTYLVTLDSDLVQLIQPNVTHLHDAPLPARQRDLRRGGRPRALRLRRRRAWPTSRPCAATRSDNIPGVPGIGDGTAIEAARAVRQHRGHLRAHRRGEAGQAAREPARSTRPRCASAKDMATIRRDVPDIILDMEEARDRPLRPPARPRPAARPRVPHPGPAPAAGRGGLSRRRLRRRRRRIVGQPSRRSYTLVNTEADLDALVARMREAGALRLRPRSRRAAARTTACSSASTSPWRPGEAYYIPVGHQPALGGPPQLAPRPRAADAGAAVRRPRRSRRSPTTASSTSRYLASRGIHVHGFAFDTLLAAYILGEGALSDSVPSRRRLAQPEVARLTPPRLRDDARSSTSSARTARSSSAIDQTRIEDAAALRLRERRLHAAPARAPGEGAARAGACGTSSRTSRCRSCRCSRAWRRRASPSTSTRPARDVAGPRRADRRTWSRQAYDGGRPRVQHRLAAAALAGAVRGAGAAEDAPDEAGLHDRRPGDRGAARRAPHRRHHPASGAS